MLGSREGRGQETQFLLYSFTLHSHAEVRRHVLFLTYTYTYITSQQIRLSTPYLSTDAIRELGIPWRYGGMILPRVEGRDQPDKG
jgi:hypothetical protein